MPSGRTIFWWLLIGFLAYWVITNPAGAAHAAHAIGHLFTQAAHGLSAFFSNLSG
jgi:hypothetical protein